jgi:hypothetical protein
MCVMCVMTTGTPWGLKSEGTSRGSSLFPLSQALDPKASAVNELEAEIYAGAIAALRKRAARQAAIARAGSATTEAGVVIRTSESAIAHRLAEALAAAADELERGRP